MNRQAKKFRNYKFWIYKKKIPLISNAYLPQNIIDQAQIAKIKVYKVIRDSKTNFKFDVKEKIY